MVRGLVRQSAALLLFASLGGQFGLPELDAWLYHRAPTPVTLAPVHIDPPGGCDSHAERCIAATTVGAPRLATAATPPLPPRVAAVDTTPAVLASRPRQADLHTVPQPRAPPTQLS